MVASRARLGLPRPRNSPRALAYRARDGTVVERRRIGWGWR
jgi:hypothetical protein